MKAFYNQHGNVYAGFLQKHYPNLYLEGLWLNGGDWDAALLREKGVPLYPAYVLKHYPALFSAALRIFRSWANALIAAGLDVRDSPHDGRRGVLRALRDALEQHSENDLPEKLKLHAAYYFGSLRKAKAALKTDHKLLGGWSKAKIIAMIIQRHRSGKPLDYASVRRNNPRLVSAAEAYFGSWGNALHTAGVPEFVSSP
jgi:hypothetical protein